MKELTKTKRISVSMIGYLAIVLIGIISLHKPSILFSVEPSDVILEIEEMTTEVFPDEALEYITNLESNIRFVDLRDKYLFTKSHLQGAINIQLGELLDKESITFFKQNQKDSITVVLYANDQTIANNAWMILYQIGYKNTKVLLGGYQVISNPNFDPEDMAAYLVEEPAFDFAQIMEEAEEKSNHQVILKVNKPTSIIPVQRIEEDLDEGGC